MLECLLEYSFFLLPRLYSPSGRGFGPQQQQQQQIQLDVMMMVLSLLDCFFFSVPDFRLMVPFCMLYWVFFFA